MAARRSKAVAERLRAVGYIGERARGASPPGGDRLHVDDARDRSVGMSARTARTLERTLVLLAAGLALAACSQARKAGGFLAGEAKVSSQQVSPDAGPPPRAIYVTTFAVAPGAIQQQGGLFGAAEQAVQGRPHLLGGVLGGGSGGGGIIKRRTAGDNPTADQVTQLLAKSIVDGLRAEQLGFPVEELPAGAPPPSPGWIVGGEFRSVDPGNRAQRAVIGFGAGEATTEVDVEVDRVDSGATTPVLRFGSNADSGHAPGAVVTMNPYAAAAKFVLGRNATQRDIEKMGQAIAQEIAKYAREKGVAPPRPS